VKIYVGIGIHDGVLTSAKRVLLRAYGVPRGRYATYGCGGAATHNHRLCLLNGAAVLPGGAAANEREKYIDNESF
jgi:hypothetical protein